MNPYKLTISFPSKKFELSNGESIWCNNFARLIIISKRDLGLYFLIFAYFVCFHINDLFIKE